VASLCSILEDYASELGSKPLFVFPETRWNGEDSLSYSDLAFRSASAARVFSANAKPTDRALLLFPTGASFWEAFFGCLRSRIMAVPLNVPNFHRNRHALEEICRDCKPSIVITDQNTSDLIARRADDHPTLCQLRVITPEEWRNEPAYIPSNDPAESSVAFLQYTSGSTARPKGIQISQENLLANLGMIQNRMNIRISGDTGVTWLPHYHDMGLVGGYLAPFFTKNTTWALPPEAFALNPSHWLQLISTHSASICGGPDFGYRYCVEKIRDDQLSDLDLRSWRVAFVGAERVRPETLSRFADKFGPHGFEYKSFFPCYGLGEATLMATGGPAGVGPTVRTMSSEGMRRGRIIPAASPEEATVLVSGGQTFDGCQVLIQDLESDVSLPDEQIGEICISGPATTPGYFHRDELNNELFCWQSFNGHTKRFLKTGDLGFLSDGELFITGRIKELIIIRGQNFSPEDLELQIEGAHEAMIPGGIVAFSVERDEEESLVIAVELHRNKMTEETFPIIVSVIRNRVIQAFGVNPSDILLLRQATIPRTSSGKAMRLGLRGRYLDRTIGGVLHESTSRRSDG
jgi:acyl-CoA synthetase (AMP-forming)/AMP-acid ligase II